MPKQSNKIPHFHRNITPPKKKLKTDLNIPSTDYSSTGVFGKTRECNISDQEDRLTSDYKSKIANETTAVSKKQTATEMTNSSVELLRTKDTSSFSFQ